MWGGGSGEGKDDAENLRAPFILAEDKHGSQFLTHHSQIQNSLKIGVLRTIHLAAKQT